MIESHLNVRGYMLFDGALDTYCVQRYVGDQKPCGMVNLDHPKWITVIHQEYIEAGVDAIKAGTFSANEQYLEYGWETIRRILQEGYRIAKETTKDRVKVFADIGPIMEQKSISLAQQCQQIIDVFLAEGVNYFLLGTLLDTQELYAVTSCTKEQCPQACTVVSFAVATDGYSRRGIVMSYLLQDCLADEYVDVCGLNRVCGSMHTERLPGSIDRTQRPILIMPSAGYPTTPANRTCSRDSSTYFAKKMQEIWQKGVRLLGGYCGATLICIQKTKETLQEHKIIQEVQQSVQETEYIPQEDHNPLHRKLQRKQPIIVVEFDSLASCEIKRFMNHVEFPKEAGVDTVTIADCPIARIRIGSSLIARKLHRGLGLGVIPHMTCRDHNINAIKALLSGLQVEGICNVLVAAGDPIPSEGCQEAKGISNFNSQILAGYIRDLSATMLVSPFMVFGALNLSAVNFEAGLTEAKCEVMQGMEGSLAQPVHSRRTLFNLKGARRELQAYILGGVLSIVSHHNAVYMNNGISGIEADREIVAMHEGTTRREARKLAVDISCRTMDKMRPYIDGYYLIMPFNRVEVIADMITYIHK